jgi:2-hydroxy-6-oxonona-2,4-dienedioate hydrolase
MSHAVGWRDIDGVPTRVLEAGLPEARPVLLLHGTGGHLEAFVHNIAPLARTARVVAYDLPGHGWSGAATRSYEIKGYCRHLESLLDAFGVERAMLVGQSLGGWIATRFAYERPERVERLLLVGPGGTMSDPAVMEKLRDSSLAAVTAPTADSVRRRLGLVIADPARITEELVHTRLKIYEQPGAPGRMRGVLCLQDPETRERNLLTSAMLAAVPHPTLVVVGDRDNITPPSVCQRFADRLPAGRLSIMPGCGHWPQFEMPAKFNAIACTFLTGDPAGAQAGSKAFAGSNGVRD